MTFTEAWASEDVGKKKPIESKWTPIKNKDKIFGIKNKEWVDKKIDTISTRKEIQNTFPRLSTAWIDKIVLSYKQFDNKSITVFFSAIKKYNTKNYPQSLIATSLIQYGNNVNDGKLSVANYETYLQSLVDENEKLKSLYTTFNDHKNPAFVDFKRFKETYKNKPQTIDQITQGKWFTTETYVFFQYLSSKSFQTNKTNIISSLSVDDRRKFNQYVRSDARIRQMVWVTPIDIVKGENIWLDSDQQESKEGTFADAKNMFMSDVDKENWPKQIVENVDETVFWTEWLVGDDIQNLFLKFQKTFSKEQRILFLQRYPQLIPAKMNKDNFINYCMGIKWQKNLDKGVLKRPNRKLDKVTDKGFDQRRDAMYKGVFENIVRKWLQPQTKSDMQQHVMDVYFEQVAWILQAGGEIVKTESVTYNKDGTIDMKYSTPRGIQGTIHISPSWEVTILDMFAYRSENEQWDNQNIIEKIQNKLMDGRLPSMKAMMTRSSLDKWTIFEAWTWNIADNNKDSMLIEKSSLAGNMVTPNEEHSRKTLDISMNKMLSMTQTADKLWAFVDHTYTVLWLPKNDIYTRYLQWEVWFLDSKVNTQIEWLFALRTDLLNNAWHTERFNTALDTLLKIYQWSYISKEKFPFGTTEESGKETLFQFISRFCTSGSEFDITAFETCIQHIDVQKPNIPESFWDFYQNNVTLFPSKSLYLSRYPEENLHAQKEKEIGDVVVSTGKALSDLRNEIQLGIDLDNTKPS